MATSGSFNTSGYSDAGWPDHYTFSWSLTSQNIAGNYSVISWSLKGAGGDNSYRYTTVKEKYVTVNGSTQSNATLQDTYNGTTPFSGTTTIYHKSDGTGSFSASAGGAFYYYGSYNSTGSGTWSLPTIPRASSFGTISGNTIGSNMTVNINRNSSSFTHQLWYKLGNSAWYDLGTGIGTSKTFTVSNDLLSQLPSATSGTLQLCIRTYNGTAQVGSDVYKNITVYVANSVVPTVGTITLTPQTYNYLIQNKNKLSISVASCTAGTGSGIKSYTFSGPGISSTTTSTSVTSSTISNTGTLTYTVTVTDNRGRTASKTKTITCYAWSAPSITLSAYRVASSTSTTQNDSGTYLRCDYTLTYSSVNTTNDVTVKIHYKKGSGSYSSVTALTDSKNTSGNQTLSGISIDSTYTVYATVTDNYGGNSPSSQVTIFSAERVCNITKDGTGVAFGKIAEHNKLLESRYKVKSPGVITSRDLRPTSANTLYSDTGESDYLGTMEHYLATSSMTSNKPSLGDGHILHFHWDTTEGCDSQLYLYNKTGAIMSRGCEKGTWGSWRTVLDSANYKSFAYPKATTLYNSTGTDGTVTLSDKVSNYTYLEIFYKDNNGNGHSCMKVYSPDSKKIDLSIIEASDSTPSRTYIRRTLYTISGTTIIPDINTSGYVQIDGKEITQTFTNNNHLRIIRVLGYA